MNVRKGHQTILILDFGSQYTQLIARRIRELGVYSEIQPYNTEIPHIKNNNIRGIILSGGPSSFYSENAPLISKTILDLNTPVLGICYVLQLNSSFSNYGFYERLSDRISLIIKVFVSFIDTIFCVLKNI